jgi:hypothetical protein
LVPHELFALLWVVVLAKTTLVDLDASFAGGVVLNVLQLVYSANARTEAQSTSQGP